LQEVTTWRVGPGPNPTAVLFDMLQELLDALAADGQHYVPEVVAHEFDVQAPLPDLKTFVEVADSNIILARADENLQLSNIETAHFATLLTFSTFVGPVTVLEGWGSADVRFQGQSLRFVVTHLQPFAPQAPATLFIQEAQAAELVSGPANTALPVIIAGDFNADADHPLDPTFATYQEMILSSFGDAWAATHPGEQGLTCCQLPDLSNMLPTLNQRIDFLFFRGQVRALNTRLAGAQTRDRVDGLWPSDHAGVRATLLVGAQ
jgi:endonuclease/exonuclease/phosphatase family metal-dependent hydrolase